ncbi:lamin tail domain-containing protein, partial [candidate division WOR-3 bacterium]|nr:lamin tail domain-containing protein [candidate division WOR-3 bacterium]
MNPVILSFAVILLNQTPLLNESFTDTAFPPAGWDTLRSDTTMNNWYRYYYGTAVPDAYQARVRVYDANNLQRTGWSTLKTEQVNMASAAGQESLFFWYRFSVDANNLGPDDTMYVDISNNDMDWINLMKLGQGADTNVWQTARIDLLPYDDYATARIRFHYVDQPNDSLASFNCNFWLDSVQVLNYDTIPETVVLNELCPDPRTFDHNANNNFSNLDEEYIELFNATNNAISIAHNVISTGPGTLTIPAGFTIPDSGYVLLYASGELLVIDRNGNVTQSGTWLGTWP